MTKRKILILGRSGCGKDTLAHALTKQFGMKQLCSTTTRPRRYAGEDSHVFVSEKEAEKMTERVAETTINGYQYFATKQQYEECDIYVIDPCGLECLVKNAPDIPLCIVYVSADDDIRKKRAVKRADSSAEAERVFEKRHADEDAMFSAFEKTLHEFRTVNDVKSVYPNVDVVIVIENNYTDKAVMDKLALHVEYAARIHPDLYSW